jgi:transposase
MPVRRYNFALYPTPEQDAVLHRHRQMVAQLWNALLQRFEDISRRTVQRTVWFDADGKRHVGITVHSTEWISERYAQGEVSVIPPGKNGRAKPYTDFDMQNEITWLCNSHPEWREASVWCWHRTAQQLHRAFEAFYRRVKSGQGAKAGYPKYRSTKQHNSIPHRFLSGCKMVRDARHFRSWKLTVKGVPGSIHARGMFPSDPEKWTDADIIWRNGKWSISVCVDIAREYSSDIPRLRRPLLIRLDLLDGFAEINGRTETPDELADVFELMDRRDQMQAEHDRRWPRGRYLDDEAKAEHADSATEISRLATRIARKRANALHVWSTRIVERAASLRIVKPASIREATKSPRGDESNWGAMVETVSKLNRHVLAYAPAMAVEMLKYKAEERGIRCVIIEDDAPNIMVGGELVAVGKQLRRARRAAKRIAV